MLVTVESSSIVIVSSVVPGWFRHRHRTSVQNDGDHGLANKSLAESPQHPESGLVRAQGAGSRGLPYRRGGFVQHPSARSLTKILLYPPDLEGGMSSKVRVRFGCSCGHLSAAIGFRRLSCSLMSKSPVTSHNSPETPPSPLSSPVGSNRVRGCFRKNMV